MIALKTTPSCLVVFALALAGPGCKGEPQEQQQVAPTAPVAAPAVQAPAAAPTPSQNGLVLVSERHKVCMVNNQFLGRDQIPVEVEGRTYFGCCPMCKERLEKSPELRTGIDPVTQRAVDKATAVIGMKPSGDVLYFESMASFESFTRG